MVARKTVGYHGTSLSVANEIVSGRLKFKMSNHAGDWLGYGAYFFEDGPRRAFTWAKHSFQTTINEPAVVAVDIALEDCLDLADLPYCIQLKRGHGEFEDFERRLGFSADQAGLIVKDGRVFTTESADTNPKTRPDINNFRDRAYINWFVARAKRNAISLKSVRGVFLDGYGIFETSFLFDWAHIQICVRDHSVISNPRLITF